MPPEELNPYAAPEEESYAIEPVSELDTPTLTRQCDLEGVFRLVAICYIALASLSITAGAIIAALMVTRQLPTIPGETPAVIFAIMCAYACTFGMIGYGVWHFYSYGRWGAFIFSVMLAFHFPFGTLFHGNAVYHLCSSVGRKIFTPEYRELVRQTPHIQPRYNEFSLWAFGLFWLQFLIICTFIIFA